jgi:hypothetical protein
MSRGKWKYLFRRIRFIKTEEALCRPKIILWRRKLRKAIETNPTAFCRDNVYLQRREWSSPGDQADLGAAFNAALVDSVPSGWILQPEFWTDFKAGYPSETELILANAEKIVKGSITLFQWKKVDLQTPLDWSATFEPGRIGETWPSIFYPEISFHHRPDRPSLDVKWAWELNRFQWLLPLGMAWRISRDQRFAFLARQMIEDWMNRVCYPFGVQWSSNLEVALRVLSFTRCHLLCADSPAWTGGFLNNLLSVINIHLLHIENELTLHHTDGNHLLGEAAALCWCSLVYPLFTRSASRIKGSLEILNSLIPRLITADGVYREQSTGYFKFVLEFLLPLIRLLRNHGLDLSDDCRRLLGQGIRFLNRLSPDMRDMPMIGDSDTGSAIGTGFSDYWDFRPVLVSGALILEAWEPSFETNEFPAESFLMLGREGLDRFQKIKSGISQVNEQEVENPIDHFIFDEGGYRITRDKVFSVIFDVGSLGLPPRFDHGHSDGLSFQMHACGRPFLVDPGTMVYNADKELRNYFRGSSAHNTLAADSADHTETLGTFCWSDEPKIKAGPVQVHERSIRCSGKLKAGKLVFERCIIHQQDRFVWIVDNVEKASGSEIEWYLHFHPDWTVNAVTDQTVDDIDLGQAIDIFFIGWDLKDISLIKGSNRPISGWYSRYYGFSVATFTMRLTSPQDVPTTRAMLFKRPDGSSGGLLSQITGNSKSEFVDPYVSKLLGNDFPKVTMWRATLSNISRP